MSDECAILFEASGFYSSLATCHSSLLLRAVSFLLHFPYSSEPPALRGTLPCGVRTFLPPNPKNLGRRPSDLLPSYYNHFPDITQSFSIDPSQRYLKFSGAATRRTRIKARQGPVRIPEVNTPTNHTNSHDLPGCQLACFMGLSNNSFVLPQVTRSYVSCQ